MLFPALFRQSLHYTLLHDLQNKAPDFVALSVATFTCHCNISPFFLKTRGRLNLFQTAFSCTINLIRQIHAKLLEQSFERFG